MKKIIVGLLVFTTSISSVLACPNALRLSKTEVGVAAINKFEHEFKEKFLSSIEEIGLVIDKESLEFKSKTWYGSDLGARIIKASVLLNDGTKLKNEEIYHLYSQKVDDFDLAGNLAESKCILKGNLYGVAKIFNAKTLRTVTGFVIDFGSTIIP